MNHSSTLTDEVAVLQTGIYIMREDRYRHENNGIFFFFLIYCNMQPVNKSLSNHRIRNVAILLTCITLGILHPWVNVLNITLAMHWDRVRVARHTLKVKTMLYVSVPITLCMSAYNF